MKLKQNVWKNYGLRASPFDTKALSLEKNLLPIRDAYVGRGEHSRENTLITNILSSPGGCRFVVEGEIGVGKTSFVNYHRFLWENEAEDKILTTESEISVYENWTVKDFLINILSAVMDRLQELPEAHSLIKKDQILQEIFLLSKVYKGSSRSYGLNAFNFGFSTEKNESIHIPNIPEIQMLKYFRYLVEKVKELGFVALFLHLDNLELIKNSTNIGRVQNLFENLRDAVQTPDVYFAFVAYKGFFHDIIAPRERLRSVFFGRSLDIPPLKKEEVIRAIERRYSILKLENNQLIRPFDNDFISYLYDCYQGKIRFIMEAASTLIPYLVQSPIKTLNNKQAQKKLKEILYGEIREKITPQEWEILTIAATKNSFTNKEISKSLDLKPSNVSRSLQKLSKLELVRQVKKNGSFVNYQVMEDIRVITSVKSKKSKVEPRRKIPAVEARTAQAMRLIKQTKKITTKEYAKKMGVSIPTARNDLIYLARNNHVIKKGSTKSSYFELTS